MPNLNRRGPMGEGPMTGRRMGRCNSDNKEKPVDEIIQNNESSVKPEQGFGLGRGRGQGRGRGPGRGMGMRFRGGDV
jgi:hypothetical protein